ncbi:hypothetical protein D3C75_474350 [compost metagenome]
MNLIQECQEILAEAQKSTMRMNQVARVARILRDAGIQLSYHNIADYGNFSDEEVEKIFKWNLSTKRNAKLDFDINTQVEAKGDYSKLLAGLLYMQTHRKQSLPTIALKSGLSEERVRELLSAHARDVRKEFPEFNTLWTKGATPSEPTI